MKTTPKNYHIPLEDRRRLIRSNASSACTAFDGSSIYSPWPATTSSRSLGRDGVTIPELAYATGVSQLAIRRLFGALHHLFGLILKKHLGGILAAVGAMPRGALPARRPPRRLPQRHPRRARQAHAPAFPARRTALLPPPDEREPVDMQRNMIAHMVGGQNAEAVLALLDAPTLDRVTMEATIAIWEQIDHERESAPQAGHYQPGLDLPEPPPGQPRTKLYPGRLLPFTRLDPKFG